jgi:hypothetical protein
VALVGARTLTVRRTTSGEFVDGTYETTTTTLTVRGTLHPLGDRDRQLLPEGLRSSARAKLYTTTELTVMTTDQPADRIVLGGRDLVVTADSDWFDAHIGGVPHYRYILTEPSHEEV